MASKVLCGTPAEHCSGGLSTMGPWNRAVKVHSCHEEAFACYARYLVQVCGYVQVAPRDFRAPDGSIQVLTKRSHFGLALRPNKEGGRWMPALDPHGRGGIISK